MKLSFQLLTALLISVALMNCKSAQNNSSSAKDSTGSDATVPTAELVGTYWKLIELNGKPVAVTEEQAREPHFILQSNDSTVRGHGGCNGFGGKYEAKPHERIRFSKIVSTMMACDNTPTENEFFQTLEKADNYYLKNDTLMLNRAKMATLAKFKAVYLK